MFNKKISHNVNNYLHINICGCRNLASVAIHSDFITTLPSRIFYYSAIKSIELPESIKVIDRYAFQSCYYLETIYIPKGLESVGTEAFDGADAIHTIYYGGSEGDWANISVVDYHNDVLKLATKVYNYVKPSAGLAFEINSDGTSYSVTGLGKCTDTDIAILSEHNRLPVTHIASGSFAGTAITSVIIPDSVTHIGNSAFELCRNITSLSCL